MDAFKKSFYYILFKKIQSALAPNKLVLMQKVSSYTTLLHPIDKNVWLLRESNQGELTPVADTSLAFLKS